MKHEPITRTLTRALLLEVAREHLDYNAIDLADYCKSHFGFRPPIAQLEAVIGQVAGEILKRKEGEK